MSYQCNGKTTVYTSGCWKKVGGKMEFVETTFERPTDFDGLLEPLRTEQVSPYECISSSSESPNSPGKEICSFVEQSNKHVSFYCQDERPSSNNMTGKIMERLDELENVLQSIQQENKALKRNVAVHESNIDGQLTYIYSLEQNLARLDQYGRRENIELLGIPSSVKDSELKLKLSKS